MSWKHDHYEWYYILIFGVIFGVAMSFAFDNFIVGFIFGLSIAMALGKKHRAEVDGDNLVFGVGEKAESVPLREIERLGFDESKGEMTVRTHDGTAHSLDAGWDKKGLGKFVGEVKQKYQL